MVAAAVGAPAQMAFPQVSPSVQALPSSHATVLFTWTQASTSVGAVSLQESPVQTLPSSQSSAAASHAPLSGLQISMPLQKLPSPGHSTVSPLHCRWPSQWSPVVQRLPSSHVVVTGLGACHVDRSELG